MTIESYVLQIIFVLLGFVSAVGIGQYSIQKIMSRVWEGLEAELNLGSDENQSKWTVPIYACVERAAFFSAFLIGMEEFIAVWLGVKFIAQWRAWQKRGIYNAFMLGNCLAVIWSVLSALFTKYSLIHEWHISIPILAALYIFSFIVWKSTNSIVGDLKKTT